MICECEDITHFEDGQPERLTQRYNAHTYGTEQPGIVATPTDFGTFFLCRECRDRAHSGYVGDLAEVGS
jgi:hypothetical protein